MRGPIPAVCTFPEVFLQEAEETIRQRTARFQDVQRFCLVLLLHEQPRISNDAAASEVGLSPRQVRRWRQRWAQGEFTVEDLTGRGRKVTFSPDGPGRGHRDRV
jgi:hypothetical protein